MPTTAQSTEARNEEASYITFHQRNSLKLYYYVYFAVHYRKYIGRALLQFLEAFSTLATLGEGGGGWRRVANVLKLFL